MKNLQKSPQNFLCHVCDYACSKKNEYAKHLNTAKHKNRTLLNGKIPDIFFACKKCNKIYSARNSLWYHEKKCLIVAESTNFDSSLNNNTMMFELMKSNNEFKELIVEQNKQLLELVKENGLGGNTINSNNTNNFNLNLFLNEKCKDAMNIGDFIKSLEISFEDFENVGTLGYAEGISKILINNLKNTEVEKRPMHCSDLKRETMYIKDKDTWENDKEKTLFISAIKGVAHRNFMKSMDWKKENPDYCDSSSKTMDKYNKILYETSGPISKEEKEKEYNKILRRIAKEVVIKK